MPAENRSVERAPWSRPIDESRRDAAIGVGRVKKHEEGHSGAVRKRLGQLSEVWR